MIKRVQALGVAEALIGTIRLNRPRGGNSMGQGGSRSFTPRARRLFQLAHGSRAAVIKKISRGGTHNKFQLANQLDYLFSKAEMTFGHMIPVPEDRHKIDPERRAEIIDLWSSDWTRAPKNGHTTHLLMSFPYATDPGKALLIAEIWAAEMFQSGEHQADEWSYAAALHLDRSHPHVHMVVNNRGLVDGTWFYMAKEHVFNLDLMKSRMVEIAAEEGISLDMTSRLERGILTYAPSRKEIEAARDEGRAPMERMRTGRALEAAMVEIDDTAKTFRALAVLAACAADISLETTFNQAALTLEAGGIVQPFKDFQMTSDTIQAAKNLEALADIARGVANQFDSGADDYTIFEPLVVARGVERPNPTEVAAAVLDLHSNKSSVSQDPQTVQRADLLLADTMRQYGAFQAADLSAAQRKELATINDEYAAQPERLAAANLDEYFEGWVKGLDARISAQPLAKQAGLRAELNELAGEVAAALGDEDMAILTKRPPLTDIYRASEQGAGLVLPNGKTLEDPAEVSAVRTAIRVEAVEAGLDGGVIEARMKVGATSAFEEREWMKSDVQKIAQTKSLDLTLDADRSTAANITDRFYAAVARVLHNAELHQQEVSRPVQPDPLIRTLNHMADRAEKAQSSSFESEEHALRFTNDLKKRYGDDIVKQIAAGNTEALAADVPDEQRRLAIARGLVSAAKANASIGLRLEEANHAEELLLKKQIAERGHDNGYGI